VKLTLTLATPWQTGIYRAVFVALPTGVAAGATAALAGSSDKAAILTGIVAFCTAFGVRTGEGAVDNGSQIQRQADIAKVGVANLPK
jgi:hypothetical protein